jgi:superfamily II DNA/RNA helicase
MPVDEIPGFPESIIEAKLFDLDNGDTTAINKAWDEMSEQTRKPGVSELAEMMKARHRTEWLKCDLLNDLVKDRLDEGTSVVVFMNFKDTVERLVKMLHDNNVMNVSILTGDSNDAERLQAMVRFQSNENHVFVCTTGAGGVAISLHDVRHERPRVAYINPSYSASETKQALGRIARVGGTRSVCIFPLVANTIEERVFRAITSKCRAIDSLNDGDLR